MSREVPADAIRRVYSGVLGKIVGFTRSLVEAEDAVHDAIERALIAWATGGMPEHPEAWLVTVAQNAHRDRLRRSRRLESRGDALAVLAQLSPWAGPVVTEPAVLRGFKDDLLRLLFACCHPSLEEGECAALALSTVLGLANDEIALAFLVAPRTMEQRLTRARQRLRQSGDVDGTTPELGRERLPAVLRTLHLLFNEGYWSSAGDAPIRGELCRLSLGLCRSLESEYPDEPEVLGLLALLLLHEARSGARIDGDGQAIPLPEQERARWDASGIARATALLDRALTMGAPGPFQIEAAIAATHCRAKVASETDWPEIAQLYELLEWQRPTPAVRVNRAFAVGQARGARQGLDLLECTDIDARRYPYVHLVRGSLLAEAGQHRAAVSALREAALASRNAEERRQIEARIASLSALEPNLDI